MAFFYYTLIGVKSSLISNKIKYKKYGDIIESKSTNDYKRCSCGAVAIDSGNEELSEIEDNNMNI